MLNTNAIKNFKKYIMHSFNMHIIVVKISNIYSAYRIYACKIIIFLYNINFINCIHYYYN